MDVTASNFTQDVTPNSSFNTIQFQSETANVIVSSILVTLILTNIGSIVSKVVLRSPLTTFPFHSFRRFIIFETTDDPFRLLNWIRGNNRYRDKSWKRKPHMVRLKYLLFPLSARVLLIVASIVSIAITIPTQQTLSGCDNGDYRPILDPSQGRVVVGDNFRCRSVSLTSRLGTVQSNLELCALRILTPSLFNSSDTVARAVLLTDGLIRWELEAQESVIGSRLFFHWTKVSGRGFNSLSSLSISPEQLLESMLEGLATMGFRCGRGATIPLEASDEIESGLVVTLTGCILDILAVTEVVNPFLRSSLTLERVEEPQMRYDISTGQQMTICPIDVVVQQAYVNILPLTVVLVAIFIVNMLFTVISSGHGNVVESYFHVVKELFGYDCMSNPLERSLGAVNEWDKLELKEFVGEHDGHARFLDPGDTDSVRKLD